MKGMNEIERLRCADEIVQAALACADGELAALLDASCGGDNALRAEVESLLSYRERARGFIETPAYALGAELIAKGPDEDLELQEGRQVGPYRIVREIGRGGMGVVFLAERSDGEFKQQVALKIVWRNVANADLRRRFRQERQILASLNHPGIARLFDGGVTIEGEPFLVMEYVEGVRIDDFCERDNLSIADRLRLFLKVCTAVSYAHQHLVVHRDIKPSNILVSNEGLPKLLDFGIAKLLDPDQEATQTRTEMRAFTPDYSAPEQVRGGGVTTAADVYSLGVLLDHLLRNAQAASARRYMVGGWRSLSLRATKGARTATDDVERSPQRQPQSSACISGDLQHIIGMARREEPARRYASVQQFAEDLQRYLEGLPVRAQKDSFTYRAGKFVRRNKRGVAAAAVALLSLFIGLTVAVWQAHIAAHQRDRAERRFTDVRQLSNALLTDIAPKIERLEGSTAARQALVSQSLKYLDSLASESADDRALQGELASAYEKVGALQGAPEHPNLSDFPGAVASYRKAQAIRLRLLDASPGDAENRRLLAANYNDLANILFWTNDFPGSLEASREARGLYEKLVAERPESVALKRAQAETNLDIGQTHSRNQHYADAYPHLRGALASLEEIRRTNPDDTEALRLLAKGHTLLGVALSWDTRQDEAEAEMAEAVKIGEALVERSPNDVILRHGLWFTYLQASSVYEETGVAAKDVISEEFARKALSLVTGTLEKDPANVQARQNLAQSYSKLAVSSGNLNKLDEAVSYAEKALAIFAELERAEPNSLTYKRNRGIGYTRLGTVKHQQRDLPGALDAFEKSAASFESIIRADPQNMVSLRDVAQVCKNIAIIHEALASDASAQQRAEHILAARQNYQRALDILLQLQSQNALAEVDRKFLAEMQAAVQRYR